MGIHLFMLPELLEYGMEALENKSSLKKIVYSQKKSLSCTKNSPLKTKLVNKPPKNVLFASKIFVCETFWKWFFSTAMWYPFYIITLDRKCVKWCQTGKCKPDGPREPQYDKTCSTSIDKGWSGYCECVGGRRTLEKDCKTDVATTCEEACSKVLRYISWCY